MRENLIELKVMLIVAGEQIRIMSDNKMFNFLIEL